MPITNLTPHGISLYPVSSRPLAFERAGGGHLLVGHTSDDGAVKLDGYTRWDPEPVSARVSELRSEVGDIAVPMLVDYQGPGELPGGGLIVDVPIPVRTVSHGEVTGLPAPEEGTFYLVSLPVVAAARDAGRVTHDLLTPGDLIRAPGGEIAGVTSFYRW